jgi:small G protein signaling modulator 3
MSAPLERSVSQQSYASARSVRSSRSGTVRPKRNRLTSQPGSSASSIVGRDGDDKSLVSFPSLSPESPRERRLAELERAQIDGANGTAVARVRDGDRHRRAGSTSIVDSLVNTTLGGDMDGIDSGPASSRGALFEDAAPVSAGWIPGALHLADDAHIERLIARYGAVSLVRQIAGDLAERDVQLVGLRRRADERERALRKIALEGGLSTLDLERRLKVVEAEIRENERSRGKVEGLMSDAMTEDVFRGSWLDEATIRASKVNGPPKEDGQGKSTAKGWKDYLWGAGSGGTTKKSSAASSVNGDAGKAQTVIRTSGASERRTGLQEDLFTPLDIDTSQNRSREPSVHSSQTGRKTSLASMALRLVAGGGPTDNRGRASSATGAGSLRTPSASSAQTSASARAVSTQGGPKALMSMRRTTVVSNGSANMPSKNTVQERLEGSSASAQMASRQESYGPVEMDTMYSPEGQPPTLTHIYNNYSRDGEYLTDRFGFIYDQRRKKRQRQAAQMAKQAQRSSKQEMLTNKRDSLISPVIDDDNTDTKRNDAGANGRPATPLSTEELKDDVKPKRWQDYLKIATFPTELLSHTPSIALPSMEIMEGGEPVKSPAITTTEDGGFLPTASTTAAVVESDVEVGVGTAADPTPSVLVKDDTEPVKLLLDQLCDLHDTQQRDKTPRWNEFMRKVRAANKREGEAAAAEARLEGGSKATAEITLTDGEIIGLAGLGNKGKVGRAKFLEFRSLVLGGIPVSHRPKIWSECSGANTLRIPGYYDDIVTRSTESDDPQVVAQIKADITRTLTDNIFFRRGPGVSKLDEVLLAYARRNPEVGYCQGMNLVAANLLLIMPSTEDAFWILVAMIETILPQGYFDHSLLASRADQQVLRGYVAEVLPKLSAHFDDLSIDLETMTFQWFLSVFTDCLSAEALFRVWDVVLCSAGDGSTFLFQVALALLKLNEAQLLAEDSPAGVYFYINHQMTNHAISIDGLIQASEGLRRVVRREDVEMRREKAVEAEKEVWRVREEKRAERKAAKAAALKRHDHEVTKPPQPAPVASG